jgi:hypothetical protein
MPIAFGAAGMYAFVISSVDLCAAAFACVLDTRGAVPMCMMGLLANEGSWPAAQCSTVVLCLVVHLQLVCYYQVDCQLLLLLLLLSCHTCISVC